MSRFVKAVPWSSSASIMFFIHPEGIFNRKECLKRKCHFPYANSVKTLISLQPFNLRSSLQCQKCINHLLLSHFCLIKNAKIFLKSKRIPAEWILMLSCLKKGVEAQSVNLLIVLFPVYARITDAQCNQGCCLFLHCWEFGVSLKQQQILCLFTHETCPTGFYS